LDDGGDSFDTQTDEWEDPPWADFDKWSNLGQQNQQQAIDRLEAEAKWGPIFAKTSSLAPPPFGLLGSATGTAIGMDAVKNLFEIQHGKPAGWTNRAGKQLPQWSYWDAFNPFGNSNLDQLSRNIMDLESSILDTTDPNLPEGVAMAGWSGRGIPDDIQIDYGASRSEDEIRDSINAARANTEAAAQLEWDEGGYAWEDAPDDEGWEDEEYDDYGGWGD
jgi:hypothetical protein